MVGAIGCVKMWWDEGRLVLWNLKSIFPSVLAWGVDGMEDKANVFGDYNFRLWEKDKVQSRTYVLSG